MKVEPYVMLKQNFLVQRWIQQSQRKEKLLVIEEIEINPLVLSLKMEEEALKMTVPRKNLIGEIGGSHQSH